MPVDLAAVQADDALLDLIGRAGHTASGTDDALTHILAAWRREVHAEPFAELVDTNTALEVIRAACQPPQRRHPVFGSIAAAAAVLVIAFSAVGLVAKSARPGDPLWGVTQVLYSDYARSVETAAAVRTELNEARTALKQGNPERARESLQRVQKQLPAIGEAEGRTDLTARHRQLEQMLNEPPGADSTNLPGANLPGASTFPPAAPHSHRRVPSMSPKPSEPPAFSDSTPEPNLTPGPNSTLGPNLTPGPNSTRGPNSTTEPPNSPDVARPNRIPPGRDHPGRGYLGPDGGSPDIGPPDVGPSGAGPSGSAAAGGATAGGNPKGGRVAGGATAGGAAADKDFPGGGTAEGAIPGGGGPAVNGSPNGDPAGSHSSRRSHLRDTPPTGPVPPGCDRDGPQPPYCGG